MKYLQKKAQNSSPSKCNAVGCVVTKYKEGIAEIAGNDENDVAFGGRAGDDS